MHSSSWVSVGMCCLGFSSLALRWLEELVQQQQQQAFGSGIYVQLPTTPQQQRARVPSCACCCLAHHCRATSVQIAAQAHLIALGTASGVVHLLQQHCPTGGAAAGADGSLTPSAAVAAAAALSPIGQCGQLPYDFSRAGLDPQQLVRTLDLIDWGHTVKQTGAVASLCWAPDNRALAVGFSRQGLVVWTPSGCRLLCTLRQPPPETPASGRASAVSPFRPDSSSSGSGSVLRPLSVGSGEAPGANGVAAGSSAAVPGLQHPGVVPVDGSVLCLAWGVDGYQLVLAGQAPSSAADSAPGARGGSSSSSSSSSGVMYELSLAKSLRHHHRVTHASTAEGGMGPGVAQLGDELHVLQVRGGELWC
jgi:hypothetical protein